MSQFCFSQFKANKLLLIYDITLVQQSASNTLKCNERLLIKSMLVHISYPLRKLHSDRGKNCRIIRLNLNLRKRGYYRGKNENSKKNSSKFAKKLPN